MNEAMPAQLLPAGAGSLPPLGGGLLAAYRLTWICLIIAALVISTLSLVDPGSDLVIRCLRLAKAGVLMTVSAILFRRRLGDPVAAMLSLSFLLWTISSSVDFAGSGGAVWPVLLDRCRFLLFALALLLFPDGVCLHRWTRGAATAIVLVFLIGMAEAVKLISTQTFLPLAIGCVVLAVGALLARYRLQSSDMQKQQLKWVALGLVVGISLILTARAGAALTAPMSMPLISSLLLEGLFQLGIVVIALGFLTSLLRYRLYDAEAAINRSAVYAALTLTLVATFAASEALIELLSQRFFGAGIGNVSGAIAAAIAAVMLSPLHDRISSWAEEHFQHDLSILKKELPELLAALSTSSSVRQVGAAVLPPIENAVHSLRIALWIDGAMVAKRGMARSSTWRRSREALAPQSVALLNRVDDRNFPLRMALRCPFGEVRGWLLLGPRPDGSFYGKDDLDALAEIAPLLRQTLFTVLAREKEQRAWKTRFKLLAARLAKLEGNPGGRSGSSKRIIAPMRA